MRLKWDETGNRLYETGVSKTVLYPFDNGKYGNGVAWSGVSAINESPSGAESSAVYADNTKYLNLISVEELGVTIEAYTYPDEFKECDGSREISQGVTIGQQNRKRFGLSYQTLVGNDEDGSDYGYKIHLIYGCLAAPAEKGYNTVNDSTEAMSMSWEVSTTPVNVEGFKPTSIVTIESRLIDAAKLKKLEDVLYGTDSKEATLPLPDEIAALLA